MRLMIGIALLVLLQQDTRAQTPAGVPTGDEITGAYQSNGVAAGVGPIRIGPRRVKDLRGWALKYKRLSASAGPIASTTKYRVTAKKDGWCAEYLVTDMVPMSNAQIKPVLVAEPLGPVRTCR